MYVTGPLRSQMNSAAPPSLDVDGLDDRPVTERVSVRVKDINGPRGGIDQVCRIKVVLSNLSSVVIEAQNASLDVAIGRALTGAERAARRSLQRRRMKPRKVGARSRAA
jgi:hypothetical protein